MNSYRIKKIKIGKKRFKNLTDISLEPGLYYIQHSKLKRKCKKNSETARRIIERIQRIMNDMYPSVIPLEITKSGQVYLSNLASIVTPNATKGIIDIRGTIQNILRVNKIDFLLTDNYEYIYNFFHNHFEEHKILYETQKQIDNTMAEIESCIAYARNLHSYVLLGGYDKRSDLYKLFLDKMNAKEIKIKQDIPENKERTIELLKLMAERYKINVDNIIDYINNEDIDEVENIREIPNPREYLTPNDFITFTDPTIPQPSLEYGHGSQEVDPRDGG